jgi:hypothetical protein
VRLGQWQLGREEAEINRTFIGSTARTLPNHQRSRQSMKWPLVELDFLDHQTIEALELRQP